MLDVIEAWNSTGPEDASQTACQRTTRTAPASDALKSGIVRLRTPSSHPIAKSRATSTTSCCWSTASSCRTQIVARGLIARMRLMASARHSITFPCTMHPRACVWHAHRAGCLKRRTSARAAVTAALPAHGRCTAPRGRKTPNAPR
jgi:hypothetical protein